MPIIPMKCPACGAQLQADSDASILNCPYCGTASVMKDAIVHNYIRNVVHIQADTVNVVNQKDFIIKAGVLEKYQGESADVIIPDTVKEIGSGAFAEMRITSVQIPDGVTVIGEGAFASCTALSAVEIPGSVRSIGEQAFASCTALSRVSILKGVQEIGRGAFLHCESLRSVSLPYTVVRIAERAFYHCSALSYMIIPDNVRHIGINAFAGCSSLNSVSASPEYLAGHFNDFGDSPIGRTLRRNAGACQYCGGKFTGLFALKCSKCGRQKDY